MRNYNKCLHAWIISTYLFDGGRALQAVPALALGGVGSLPRAPRFRGPHSSKKRALQAVIALSK